MFTFPAGGQMGNHMHAGMMARVANNHRAIAAALGPAAGSLAAPRPPSAVPNLAGPAMGGPPGMGVRPISPVSPVPPVGPQAPPAAGNFKQHIAHAIGRAHGTVPSIHHIHTAIDHLTKMGRFTPLQGAALKLHNGPLVGAQGAATMGAIAKQITGVMPSVRA